MVFQIKFTEKQRSYFWRIIRDANQAPDIDFRIKINFWVIKCVCVCNLKKYSARTSVREKLLMALIICLSQLDINRAVHD